MSNVEISSVTKSFGSVRVLEQVDLTVPDGGITAVLGPTNTGKTHHAVERMLNHRTGVMGLPLRLLARRGGSLAAYALLSTLVFAAVHLTGSLPWTQFLVGLTCFFVAARFGWRTSIVTHLTFNSLIFCAVIGG